MAILLVLYLLIGVDSFRAVKTTVYHTRGLTASGEHTDEISENFIAVSRDLLEAYPMNSYVEISDCPFAGKYVVKDKMNKRWRRKIDIFLTYNGKKYNPCHCNIKKYEEPKLEIEEVLPVEVPQDSIPKNK
jgi:3D (Asp-Asp-Asp) domain-containing protein